MFVFNTSTIEVQWLDFFLGKEYFSFDKFGGQRWQMKHGLYLKALKWQSYITAQKLLASKFLFRLVLNCYWWALHALQPAIHSPPTHTLSNEVETHFLKQLKRKGIKHQGKLSCYHYCVSVGKKNCRYIVLPLLFHLLIWNEIWCKENLSPWDVSFCPHL